MENTRRNCMSFLFLMTSNPGIVFSIHMLNFNTLGGEKKKNQTRKNNTSSKLVYCNIKTVERKSDESEQNTFHSQMTHECPTEINFFFDSCCY